MEEFNFQYDSVGGVGGLDPDPGGTQETTKAAWSEVVGKWDTDTIEASRAFGI
jgi:hypothetical protein